MTNVVELVNQHPDINFVIKAGDLKELIDYCVNKTHAEMERTIESAKTETFMTPDEAAEKLHVTRSTLWRYHRKNYLSPVTVGGKRLYKSSDINKILEGK